LTKDAPGETVTLSITHLGAMGDGAAAYQGQTVFVPFTAPGDTIHAAIEPGNRARLLDIITPSPDRAAPHCPVFGQCGGCQLLHLSEETYRSFKQNILFEVARRLDVNPAVLQPVVLIGEGARRRIDIKIAVHKGIVRMGFFAAKSHELVDITECLVTTPGITTLFAPLRALFSSFKKPGVLHGLALTQVEAGFDALVTLRAPLHPLDTAALEVFAAAHGILRIYTRMNDEQTLKPLKRGTVTTLMASVAVELPPGAFLQATQAGQALLTDYVLRHTEGLARVVDIYAGCGTYSFPMAARGQHVRAVEGDEAMVHALHNAIRNAGLEARMTAQQRDLFKNPLRIQDVDAVVINPPRNGAKPQIENIARSRTKVVVMLSCNPATFERDARVLLESGYELTDVTPIDQFHGSYHLEVAAAFRHPGV
jgi:23S rRNA (uracil1939-C5)-methyltransferase